MSYYKKDPDVICLGDLKQASLYFHRVLPLNVFQLCQHEDPSYLTCCLTGNDSITKGTFLDDCRNLHQSLNPITDIIGDVFEARHAGKTAFEQGLKLLSPQQRKVCKQLSSFYEKMITNRETETAIRESYNVLIGFGYIEGLELGNGTTVKQMIQKMAKNFNSKDFSILLPSFCLSSYDAQENDISLILSNIPIIDTSKTSWDQILEFRKDEESTKRLRNLRLFFHEHYGGKSKAFIEDDFNNRLEQYIKTCKDYNFETIRSTFAAVFDAKSILAALAAFLFSGNIGGITAAITSGLAVEFGQIALHVVARKHALHKIKRDHELAYVIEARKKLEP